MKPYETNGEYLDQEFEWLRATIARINEDKEVSDDEVSFRLSYDENLDALRLSENRLRDLVDARLTSHREHGKFELGLDQLCNQHGLGENERLIVIALTAPAISESLGDQVLGQLCAGASLWVTVSNCMDLLDPLDVDGWLSARSLFLSTGKLRKENIIEVRANGSDRGAFSEIEGPAYLSKQAFEIIVGINLRR